VIVVPAVRDVEIVDDDLLLFVIVAVAADV